MPHAALHHYPGPGQRHGLTNGTVTIRHRSHQPRLRPNAVIAQTLQRLHPTLGRPARRPIQEQYPAIVSHGNQEDQILPGGGHMDIIQDHRPRTWAQVWFPLAPVLLPVRTTSPLHGPPALEMTDMDVGLRAGRVGHQTIRRAGQIVPDAV
ncbi:MAG: hypothetical protein AB1566_03160, partial [Chloroflexota bacterium]